MLRPTPVPRPLRTRWSRPRAGRPRRRPRYRRRRRSRTRHPRRRRRHPRTRRRSRGRPRGRPRSRPHRPRRPNRARPPLRRRIHNPPIAIHHHPIKRHVLHHGAHPLGAGPRAGNAGRGAGVQRSGVLDVEDGFARGEEGGVAGAFVELGALLVDGEVDGGGQRVEDVETVFEADAQGIRRGDKGHPLDVVDCVLGEEGEPVVVLLGEGELGGRGKGRGGEGTYVAV